MNKQLNKAKSATSVEVSQKEKAPGKNIKRRKTSDSSQVANVEEQQPGQSGAKSNRKQKQNSSKQKLKKNNQKKTDNKASASASQPASNAKTRSASDSNLGEATTSVSSSGKQPLKKTKSDSSVDSIKGSRKRKAAAVKTNFSPKKLRSSSTSTASSSASATTTTKEVKTKKAKTGGRSSRERNPPEVDEPAGDSTNKLGSSASRRYALRILLFFTFSKWLLNKVAGDVSWISSHLSLVKIFDVND